MTKVDRLFLTDVVDSLTEQVQEVIAIEGRDATVIAGVLTGIALALAEAVKKDLERTVRDKPQALEPKDKPQ